ncbi:fibronectin type 3 and ankyrin repeat domains protein 1-like isoform X2 [Pocillopora damicornis]|uniref:fibronectin type 3 and ankyrin repeat domains protein 1-like isoform X2 n=1 Tax=Pocillopora damicornis TaxID=46731 RepID=UPI000F54FD49|nr:fibronectin type 3 and ankyrin repeat domains protein 1-like isoform X2 [Pocillopora damicornis]
MSAPEKPAPPVVGKVTFNSIELYWDQIAGTEDSSGGRLRYCVQEEEEEGRKGFGNVYNGFAKSNEFKGLEPSKTYRYCLRISNNNGNSPWSQVISVTTTKIPLSGRDLHNAVLNWEVEKVTSILEESIISTLIAHKADVNYSNTSGKTSMMLACAGGHIKVAVMLFEKGAFIDSKDNGGSCCLHWAVDGGNTACIQWLLDNGIDVDIEDDFGCSPLIRLASLNGNVEVAKILIENGADVNKKDKIKKSALMAAAVGGNVDLIKLLVVKGADVYAENEYGHRAVDFSETFGRKEVASYLKEVMEGNETDVKPEKETEDSEDT